jgi:gp25
MIIKDYKYENSTDGIHYIVDVDGCEFEMNHKRTEYGSVQHDDIEYFLDEIAEYDMQEAELIEDFVKLQSYLLMYGIGFTLKNAEEVKE